MAEPEAEITIDEIADAFSASLERGERPSIEGYKSKYPQLAERIEAVFPALVMLEGLESRPKHNLAVDDSIPGVLGEYEIIQEIGRGGMGVVFEARHVTMRRRVALKVLPKSISIRSNNLSRFLSEARSAGQLHHSNIVPVFEVGESGGIHYYSMQFIHGDNLDRVIDDIKIVRDTCPMASLANAEQMADVPSGHGSTLSQTIAFRMVLGNTESKRDESERDESKLDDLRKSEYLKRTTTRIRLNRSQDQPRTQHGQSKLDGLSDSVFNNSDFSHATGTRSAYHNRIAAIGVQVADALEYAHSHGVLHRDVKPANLILDTEGTVWITDFGLAKRDENLTQTGDIVGTLRYMAPERFQGKADGRSDVYGLGLALYELCTLKCAFEPSEKATLFHDVQNRKPVEPRKIDDEIPADLETIILKSIEPFPARRYQSARELSEDLALFLADRPINARRTSVIERGWRVCRRNPVAATLSACVCGLLILLTLGSFWFAVFSEERASAETKLRKGAQLSLYTAKVDKAKMQRLTARVGQRYESQQAIRDATDLLPLLEFGDVRGKEERLRLRIEAISSMALADVRDIWKEPKKELWGYSQKISFDQNYDFYAEAHPDGRVRIKRRNDPALEAILPSPGLQSWQMNFSPDGRFLAVIHHSEFALYRDAELHVWDLGNPAEPLEQVPGVVSFGFAPDSTRLAYSLFDGGVEVASLPEFEIIQEISDIQARVVRFSSMGSELAISLRVKHQIEIWSLAHDEPQRVCSQSTNGLIVAMDWDSAQGILAAGTASGSLLFWQNGPHESLLLTPKLIEAHQSQIKRLHIHPFRKLIATEAYDATVRISNLVSEKESLKIVHSQSLLECGFDLGGRLAHFHNETGVAGIWEIAEPVVKVFATDNARGSMMKFHPRHPELAFYVTSTGIDIWNIDAIKLVSQVSGNFSDLAMSADGAEMFTAGNQGIERRSISVVPSALGGIDFEAGAPIRLSGKGVQKIALTRSGETLVGAAKLELFALDSQTGEQTLEFGRHSFTSSLAITGDDRWLLTGASRGNGIAVWDMASGEQVRMLMSGRKGIAATAHPINSKQVLTSDLQVKYWDVTTWTELESKSMPIMKNSNLEMLYPVSRFSPDGKLVAVNSKSNEMILIDAIECLPLARIETSGSSRLVSVEFSPDSSRIAMSCVDGLQIVDLAQLRSELAELGLDW